MIIDPCAVPTVDVRYKPVILHEEDYALTYYMSEAQIMLNNKAGVQSLNEAPNKRMYYDHTEHSKEYLREVFAKCLHGQGRIEKTILEEETNTIRSLFVIPSITISSAMFEHERVLLNKARRVFTDDYSPALCFVLAKLINHMRGSIHAEVSNILKMNHFLPLLWSQDENGSICHLRIECIKDARKCTMDLYLVDSSLDDFSEITEVIENY